jgi:hypothetical protein
MARVNVYLPDDLAERAREAELNVSAITQAALANQLAARDMQWWLGSIVAFDPVDVAPDRVRSALDTARADFGQ